MPNFPAADSQAAVCKYSGNTHAATIASEKNNAHRRHAAKWQIAIATEQPAGTAIATQPITNWQVRTAAVTFILGDSQLRLVG